MTTITNKSIKDFLQLGGVARDKRVFLSNSRRLTTNTHEQEILLKYWELLVYSNLLNETAYLFLVENKSYKEIILEKESKGEEVAEEKALANSTYKNVKKVYREIGFDPYIKVKNRVYNTERDRKSAIITLQNIRENVGDRVEDTEDVTDNLLFHNFTEKGTVLSPPTHFTEQDKIEFISIVNRLRILSKPYLEAYLSSISEENKIYLEYLITSQEEDLSVNDKALLSEIREDWWI